jgi:hypothetical protein
VKRISERPDVESADIKFRRCRARIKFNISGQSNKNGKKLTSMFL